MTVMTRPIQIRASCASCLHARDARRLGEPGLESAVEARPAPDAPEIYCSVWRALCTPDTYCAAHQPASARKDRRPSLLFVNHRAGARLWGFLALGFWAVLAGVVELAVLHRSPLS
jgi:hypothetical protein